MNEKKEEVAISDGNRFLLFPRPKQQCTLSGGLPLQECRQYKVLVKDEEEKKTEDFISKRFSVQEDDSSDSGSEAGKHKASAGNKSKKAPGLSRGFTPKLVANNFMGLI